MAGLGHYGKRLSWLHGRSIEFIFGQVLGKFWMSLAVALLIGYLHSRRAKAVQDEILSR